MYDIKLGNSCGIKATLLTPSGALCDLRHARHIGATLILPSGATMPCADVSFNEITGAVYVRLLANRELTAEGKYTIIFNVKAEDDATYSTDAVNFAQVKADATANYLELTITISIAVINFPKNIIGRGTDSNGTWCLYTDGAGMITRPIVDAVPNNNILNRKKS